jgi:hypothetical protein
MDVTNTGTLIVRTAQTLELLLEHQSMPSSEWVDLIA